MVYIADTYNKEQAPIDTGKTSLTVNVTVTLIKITEIKELDMQYSCRIKLQLSWFDSRLKFLNLNDDNSRNIISSTDVKKLWLPQLVFTNSHTGKMTTLDEGDFVSATKESEPIPNGLEWVHENLIYKGHINPLVMISYYTLTLTCPFDLSMFPFDKQKCPLIIVIPVKLQSQMNINLLRVDSLGKINLTEYEFRGDCSFQTDLYYVY